MRKEQEEWKDITNYEGLYQISNFGNVRSFKNSKWGVKETPHILKQNLDSRGYYSVNLGKTINIHKLVAQEFLNHFTNKSYDLVIDHIDGNKLNNYVYNLQIITNRLNCSKNKISTYNLIGVSFDKRRNKYQSRILINKKRISLGYFINIIDAKNIYDKALKNINLYNGDNKKFINILNNE